MTFGGGILLHQVIGAVLGLAIVVVAVVLFVRAEAQAAKFRDQARLYWGDRFDDMWQPGGIRATAVIAGCLGAAMIVLGFLGFYA